MDCSTCPKVQLLWLLLCFLTWPGTSCASSGLPQSRSAALTHHHRAWEGWNPDYNSQSKLGSRQGFCEWPTVLGIQESHIYIHCGTVSWVLGRGNGRFSSYSVSNSMRPKSIRFRSKYMCSVLGSIFYVVFHEHIFWAMAL